MAKTVEQIKTELGITNETTLTQLLTLAGTYNVFSQAEINNIKSLSVMPLPNKVTNQAEELKARFTNIVLNDNSSAIHSINVRNVIANEILRKLDTLTTNLGTNKADLTLIYADSISLSGSSGTLTDDQLNVITTFKNPVINYDDGVSIHTFHLMGKGELATDVYMYAFGEYEIDITTNQTKIIIRHVVINATSKEWYFELIDKDHYNKSKVDSLVSTLQGNINSEATTRSNADTTLQNNINTEASTRSSADTTLDTKITTEISTRATADSTLQSNINAEATARSNADSALQALIGENTADITALNTDVTGIKNVLNTEISDFDTLAEIATYLQEHTSEYTDLVADVQSNTNDIANLKSLDTGLQANEAIRQSNESTRQSNEASRVSAENARVLAEQAREAQMETWQEDTADLVAGNYIELSGTSGTLTSEQVSILASGKYANPIIIHNSKVCTLTYKETSLLNIMYFEVRNITRNETTINDSYYLILVSLNDNSWRLYEATNSYYRTSAVDNLLALKADLTNTNQVITASKIKVDSVEAKTTTNSKLELGNSGISLAYSDTSELQLSNNAMDYKGNYSNKHHSMRFNPMVFSVSLYGDNANDGSNGIVLNVWDTTNKFLHLVGGTPYEIIDTNNATTELFMTDSEMTTLLSEVFD